MNSGIYRIFSIATEESYYGSSNRLNRRFIEHKSTWRNNKGNHKIRLLLKMYGLDNFKFEVLEYCSPDQFNEKEKKYIQNDPKRLNVWILPFSSKGCSLGNNVKGKHSGGYKHTDETNRKNGERMKKYYETHDGYWKGKSLPLTTRLKVSEGLKKYFSTNPHHNAGKPKSEETKRKISESLKKRGAL